MVKEKSLRGMRKLRRLEGRQGMIKIKLSDHRKYPVRVQRAIKRRNCIINKAEKYNNKEEK